MTASDPAAARSMLRHTLATVAYRAAKTLRGAPGGFADFQAANGARTPVQLLAHLGDLYDWALELAQGRHAWHESTPLPWDEESKRFFAALRRLDEYLASDAPLGCPAEALFQGPLADSLTHVGQIGILRRLAGAPVKGENYFQAAIAIGRVGPDQPPPKREF